MSFVRKYVVYRFDIFFLDFDFYSDYKIDLMIHLYNSTSPNFDA